MKTILFASLFAVSLAYVHPADRGAPPERDLESEKPLHALELAKAPGEGPQQESSPPEGVPTFCVKLPNPVGGVEAPSVGCHDDKKKLKDSGKVKNVRFKLFVPPDSFSRLDYIWNKPNEIQAACLNACIEQRERCHKTPSKVSRFSNAELCDAQEKKCLAAQKPTTITEQKSLCPANPSAG